MMVCWPFASAEMTGSVKRKELQPRRSNGKMKGGDLYGVKGLQLTLPWATSMSRISVVNDKLTSASRKAQNHGQILILPRNPSMRRNHATYFLNSNVSDRVIEPSTLPMSWHSLNHYHPPTIWTCKWSTQNTFLTS
jgi:hypothetical protein